MEWKVGCVISYSMQKYICDFHFCQKSGDTATDIEAAVALMEAVMEKVYDVEGFPHFQIIKNEVSDRFLLLCLFFF